MELFYIAFFALQVDFGDTEDSKHIVLQYMIGKSKFTEKLIDKGSSLSILAGIMLLIDYGICLYFMF